MNIFLTNIDPEIAARDLCDLRLNKMILETAQLLCVAYKHLYPTYYVDLSAADKALLYRDTHVNHPCAVWARKNVTNYVWLYQYWAWLAYEKHIRTGKMHLSYTKLARILAEPIARCNDPSHFKNITEADFDFDCTGIIEFESSSDTPMNLFERYQACLNQKWAQDAREPKWTNQIKPAWANYER